MARPPDPRRPLGFGLSSPATLSLTALAVAALAVAALSLVPACYPYDNEIILCDVIPEGGCPVDRGGTCDDPACAAIYGCYDGVWKKKETCEGNTGGGGGSGGAGGGGGSGGDCTPLQFDHTNEAIGCKPDLQSPDCPVAAAEQCPESACLTDCSDFYICRKDDNAQPASWKSVAYCTEDGTLLEAPR